jgi:hypothetical protein
MAAKKTAKSAGKKAALPTKDASGQALGRPNASRTKTTQTAPKVKRGHVAGKLIHDGHQRKTR